MSSPTSSSRSSPIPDKLFSDPVNPLGIRRLDKIRTVSLIYGRRPKGADAIGASVLIKDIIDVENVKRVEESQENAEGAEPALLTPIYDGEEGGWDAVKHANFSMQSYMVTLEGTSKIGQAHRKAGADIPAQVTNTFLTFIFRSSSSGTDEIYALTTRHSWRVVHPYTDFSWPLTFCRYLLDAGSLSNSTSESVLGTARTTQTAYAENYKVEHLEGRDSIYTYLCLSLDREAPLLKLGPFLTSKGKVLNQAINVEVKVGQVKIRHNLALGDYPLVLDSAEQVIQGSLPARKEQQFEVLSYLSSVEDTPTRSLLESHILDELAVCLSEQKKPSYAMRHRHLEDFQKSTEDLLVVYNQKRYHRSKDSTLGDLLIFLRSIITSQEIAKELKKVRLGFDGKATHPFIDFIEGEVKTDTGAFFRINKRYYKLSGDYIALVRADFRRALPQLLLPGDDPGMLHLSWGGQKRHGNLTKEGLAKVDKKRTLESLAKEKGVYLRLEKKHWRPKFQKLEGEILTNKTVQTYRSKIEKFLKRKKSVNKVQLQKDLGVTAQVAEEIWDELKKERPILTKEKEQYYVLSPLTGSSSLNRVLAPLSYQYHARETEGCYNERYLDEPNFIVGDRICPFGIEIFDIIKWTEDTTYIYHVKEGFDLHTRDALDQLLNSVELIYEARFADTKKNALDQWYKMAINPTAVKKEDQAYRKRLKQQIEKMSLNAFKALFLKRKLVFVYAVLDTHAQESSLLEESKLTETFSPKAFEACLKKGRKTSMTANMVFKWLQDKDQLDRKGRLTSTFYAMSQDRFKGLESDKQLSGAAKQRIYKVLAAQKSQFDSTISCLALRRTVRRMERYNFEFKICQIPRASYDKEGSLPTRSAPVKIDPSVRAPLPLEFKHQGLTFHKACDTAPDGACALHALMANAQDRGMHIYNPVGPAADLSVGERAKHDFLTHFDAALAADNELAFSCMSELCREDPKMKLKHDAACAPAIQQVREKEETLDDYYTAILDDADDYQAVFAHLQSFSSKYKALSQAALKEKLLADKPARKSAFSGVHDAVMPILLEYKDFDEDYAALVKARQGIEAASHDFFKEEASLAWYHDAVLMSGYHLSDQELALAADMYNKKVILFSTSDGQPPQELNPTAPGDWVAIMHEGGYYKGHYTRLEPKP